MFVDRKRQLVKLYLYYVRIYILFFFIIAHSFVKSCKQILQDSKQDMDLLLQQLGACLYTVQSFYSNTNWVEMNGNAVYEDFGSVSI